MPEAPILYRPKSANHSPLMIALSKASIGDPPNFCPYGCTPAELDENGYCDHLIGFTIPGDEKQMEPRKVRPQFQNAWYVSGKAKQPVPVGSELRKITVSSRVYHRDGLSKVVVAIAQDK